MSELHTCTDLENALETNEIVHVELHLKRTDNTVSFPFMGTILTQKSSYKTSDKKALFTIRSAAPMAVLLQP